MQCNWSKWNTYMFLPLTLVGWLIQMKLSLISQWKWTSGNQNEHFPDLAITVGAAFQFPFPMMPEKRVTQQVLAWKICMTFQTFKPYLHWPALPLLGCFWTQCLPTCIVVLPIEKERSRWVAMLICSTRKEQESSSTFKTNNVFLFIERIPNHPFDWDKILKEYGPSPVDLLYNPLLPFCTPLKFSLQNKKKAMWC